jgi:hypothetical protein
MEVAKRIPSTQEGERICHYGMIYCYKMMLY